MKLRGRFTLWFSIAALVPIAAAALVTREVLSRSYQREFDEQRRNVDEETRRLIGEYQESVQARVLGLASPKQKFVGGLLIELQKGDGILPSIERRRLVESGRLLMTSLNLDLLFVADGTDTILVAPHNRGVRDSVVPELRKQAKATAGVGFFALEPIIRGDAIDEVLVIESGRTISEQGQLVTVAGGQIFGDRAIAKLRDGRRSDARIVDREGRELVAPRSEWGTMSTSPPLRIALNGADNSPVAWVEVTVSDAELAQILGDLSVSSAVLGGGALLLTIVFGFVVARRITGDLEELVVGAQAVSCDDYDHRIKVRSKDEISAVADAFNGMLEDLQESKERLVTAERIAAWQEIARSLAHEIKNPLTPIQMSVETMRRSHAKAHPSFEEIFDESTLTILEEVDRLKRIVSEFSEFARMPKPTKRRVHLNEVVRSAVSLYKGSVEIDCEYDDADPELEADRDQLTQVLLNLLENSRDAIAASQQEAGRILVQTRSIAGGAVAELVVADNGPGISEEARDKIFTPYFTTKGQRGTGLGLATVHRIVSDHGGRIRVEESALGGAQFVIALPIGSQPLTLTYRSARPQDA